MFFEMPEFVCERLTRALRCLRRSGRRNCIPRGVNRIELSRQYMMKQREDIQRKGKQNYVAQDDPDCAVLLLSFMG